MAAWEYSPAPESTDVVSIRDTYDLYIGGDRVATLRRKRSSPRYRSPERPTSMQQ
jgi:hypothetical protein